MRPTERQLARGSCDDVEALRPDPGWGVDKLEGQPPVARSHISSFRCVTDVVTQRSPASMGQIYLVKDRVEIERRRQALPGVTIEVWPDLYAGDLFWLGDDEQRREAYTAVTRDRPPGGVFWIGESSKAALDGAGPPLAWELAVEESLVPVYFGSRLVDADSLPHADSIRARALSARSIAVAWSTYDRLGQRVEYRPASPLDEKFYLRRPRGRTLHLFHAFPTKADAIAAMADRSPGDPGAAAWAESLSVQDFSTLINIAAG